MCDALTLQAADGGASLPAGWEVQTAPNGRQFFINHKDKTTSWTDPRTGRPTTVTAPAQPRYTPHRQVDGIGPLPVGVRPMFMPKYTFTNTVRMGRTRAQRWSGVLHRSQ